MSNSKNLYAKFYAKRTEGGDVDFKVSTVKGVKVFKKQKGTFMQNRVLTNAQVGLLQEDVSHPYFYEALSQEDVDKIVEGKVEGKLSRKKPAGKTEE